MVSMPGFRTSEDGHSLMFNLEPFIREATEKVTYEIEKDAEVKVAAVLRQRGWTVLPPTVRSQGDVVLLDGPFAGVVARLARQPEHIEIRGIKYTRLDDPDTGISLDAYTLTHKPGIA